MLRSSRNLDKQTTGVAMTDSPPSPSLWLCITYYVTSSQRWVHIDIPFDPKGGVSHDDIIAHHRPNTAWWACADIIDRTGEVVETIPFAYAYRAS